MSQKGEARSSLHLISAAPNSLILFVPIPCKNLDFCTTMASARRRAAIAYEMNSGLQEGSGLAGSTLSMRAQLLVRLPCLVEDKQLGSSNKWEG